VKENYIYPSSCIKISAISYLFPRIFLRITYDRSRKKFPSSVRGSGRLIVAQHFSAGIMRYKTTESVKRTTEVMWFGFSRPFHGLKYDLVRRKPSTKVLGYYQLSATRTTAPLKKQHCMSFHLGVDYSERSAIIGSIRVARRAGK
jgi:hypothetical protein